MTKPAHPTTVRVSDPADVLGIIPSLLGFHPTDSLVILVLSANVVVCTARIDIDAARNPEDLAAAISPLLGRFADARFVLVAYSPDPDLADAALATVEVAVGCARVLDSLRTDGARWWSRGCHDSCCPAEGTPYTYDSTRSAAEAVYAGITVLPDRNALRASIAGPSESAVEVCRGRLAESAAILEPLTFPTKRRRLARLVDRLGVDGAQPSEGDLVDLVCLVQAIKLRDRAWLAMTRNNADQWVSVWQRAVGMCPPEAAVAPLCLLGVAAWLSGNGALLNECIQRGLQLNPIYSMLSLLQDISASGAEPRLWDRMSEQRAS